MEKLGGLDLQWIGHGSLARGSFLFFLFFCSFVFIGQGRGAGVERLRVCWGDRGLRECEAGRGECFFVFKIWELCAVGPCRAHGNERERVESVLFDAMGRDYVRVESEFFDNT